MAFSEEQLSEVADILEQAGRAIVMPSFGKLSAAEIRAKTSAIDLVTDADEAAERFISDALLTTFDNAMVIGEEAVAQGQASLDTLMHAKLAFVIDPIDGTRNYASATPLFGIMVAVIEAGEVAAGIIYDPVTERRYCAVKGQGAWAQWPDGSRHPLQVAKPVALEDTEMLISTGHLDEPLKSQVNARLGRFSAVSMLLCAAHEYRLLAEGYRHASFYRKLMPWDHAAGWLIHQEAGGYSAHFDGSPYRLDNLAGGLICAPDQASWEALREALIAP
ncbi:inositol monophosphatase family protein [Carnimonas bestiolae]|uniref:inositol monophosphatase family protein n=1 Tax=Carnimonas bestiolae TaxID=3402172 RepID=UPI003EDBFDBC